MLNLPQGREWIAARVPHHGGMCLLDEIIDCDERRILCRSDTHRAADNPLRAAGRLGAACALEYAAQAMALHAAVLRESAPPDVPAPGMLAAVRELRLDVSQLDDLPAALVIECWRDEGDLRTMLYRFTVRCDGHPVASGRATVVSGLPRLRA